MLAIRPKPVPANPGEESVGSHAVYFAIYDADIKLFRHSGYVRNTALMAALALLIPFFGLYGGAPSTLSLIEIMLAIAGMGVMVVTGFTAGSAWATGPSSRWGPMTTCPAHHARWGALGAGCLCGLYPARPVRLCPCQADLKMTSTALAIATLLFMILTQQPHQWTFMGGADGFQYKIGKGSWFAGPWLID